MPGKRGNTNALKHGLYSKHISIQDDIELIPMSGDQNPDELALARVSLAHVLDKRAASKTDDDYLRWDAAAAQWLNRINNMTEHNAIMGKDSRTAFVTILEYIRVANAAQHLKP